MTNRQIEKAMTALCEEIGPWFERQKMGANNCILGTRIAVGYLRDLGVPARPVPVRLEAYSPEWVRRAAQERKPTDPGEDVHEWRRAGAHAVVTGFGRPREEAEGWDAHLVAQVKHRYLLDVTAHQVTRRAKGIDVEAFWHPVPREFWRDEGRLDLTTDELAVLRYTQYPEAGEAFLTSYDWRGITVSALGERGNRGFEIRPIRTADDYRKTMEVPR